MKTEPVIVRYVAGLIVTIAAQYGLDLTADQLLGVVAVVGAVVTYLQRRNVTPVAKAS